MPGGATPREPERITAVRRLLLLSSMALVTTRKDSRRRAEKDGSDRTWNVVVSFVTLFVVLAAYALLETARDTLFLSHVAARKLPWAYLSTALAVSLIAWQVPSLTRQASRRRTGILLGSTGAAMLGSWLLDPHHAIGLYALYTAVGVAGTLVLVQLWTLIGAQLTIREARRLFAIIAAGGALGTMAGSFLAARIVGGEGARALLGLGGLGLAGAGFGPFLLRRRKATIPVASTPEPAAPLDRVYRTEYARRIFWMVALTTIATTVGDFIFKGAVAASRPASELGSFFAMYQLVINGVGLLMQLVVAPLLFRRVGAHRMVLLLPLLTLASAIGFVFAPGLIASIMMKSVDGSLRSSVHRTSTEVLYVPLPLEVRAKLKTLVDGVGQRSAQAVASLLVLAAFALGAHSIDLAVVVAVSASACLWVAWGLRRQYVQAFRDQLRAGRLDDHTTAAPLDLHSLQSLVAMLESNDDARILAALDALVAQGKISLIPDSLLRHPSVAVVRRVLDLLAGTSRKHLATVVEPLLGHVDPTVSGGAARVYAARVADEKALRRLADDARAPVRAAGLVALDRIGKQTPADRQALQYLARRGPREGRLALLRVIAELPRPDLVPIVARLAEADDPELRVAAARALAACGDARALPLALELLGRRQVRDAARDVFRDVGTRGIAFLAAALVNPALDRDVRRHIPRTLSRFGNERAAAILLDGLSRHIGDGVTRYKMLRGLGRMRRDRPSLRLDANELRLQARAAIDRTRTLQRWRDSFDGEASPSTGAGPTAAANGAGTLLKALLARKARLAGERLFRLLDLLRPGEELHHIYEGLRHGDRALRASSRELLEYQLDPALRRSVLALVDGEPDPYFVGPRLRLEDTLPAMRADHNPAIRALADEFAGQRERALVRHVS